MTENTTISYTDYLGERIDRDKAEVDYLLHDLGRVVAADAGKWIYEYHLTDHLGNVRVAFADLDEDGDAEMLQENHYYPFGQRLNLPGYQSSDANPYLYNGKELQEDLGLRWYDYHARYYDPQIARFHTVDPLAETFQESWTPYHYCLSNPVLHTDPDGKIPPLIIAGAIILGKAIAGAAIDGGTQYGINRALGMSHSEAMNNLDYTSMAASAMISGISAPGVNTGIKTGVTLSAMAIDAAVDVSNSQTQAILGVGGADEKPLENVALDATIGVLSSKASSSIVDGSKKAVASDLAPSNYAPLDAASKKTVRTTEAVVNSEGFEQVVNSTTGAVSGAISSTIKTDGTQSSTGTSTTTFTQPVYTPQADNTRVVQQPIIY